MLHEKCWSWSPKILALVLRSLGLVNITGCNTHLPLIVILHVYMVPSKGQTKIIGDYCHIICTGLSQTNKTQKIVLQDNITTNIWQLLYSLHPYNELRFFAMFNLDCWSVEVEQSDFDMPQALPITQLTVKIYKIWKDIVTLEQIYSRMLKLCGKV